MEKKLIEEINYTTLEPVLLRINQNNVNPSENITRKHKLAYQNFVLNLNKILMQNDPLLAKYHKTEDVKLKTLRSRIGRCYNIYDYEVKVPLPSTLYTVKISKPGLITLQLSDNKIQQDNVAAVLQNWANDENFILPENFIKWGENLIEKCFGNNNSEKTFKKHSVKIERQDCGGLNLHVRNVETLVEFDVVITFTLNFNTTPGAFILKHKEMARENWVAVPIVHKADNKNWRYSFPNAEKLDLTDLNYLKCVLRLVKILREAADLTHLSNYHIKTVFLLEVESQKTDFWKKGLSYLFIIMICRLQLALDKKEIPFYWDKSANLLDDLTVAEVEDCRVKLTSFIDKIHQSFTVKPHVKLDDFLVNKDDDDILSQSMLNFHIK
ncbi:cyclic GMP-AMP synthase-like receptor [Arctopsyche grandis]|uniref:cyclic GMP-AMP synthase-like receptor n=1 Tax=Arctopsyche grandis TaxID=121162 RepID=UPI00406D832F